VFKAYPYAETESAKKFRMRKTCLCMKFMFCT
jgi:hypothetical protein